MLFRSHGKGRHDGYTAARDGAALQRWTARRHDGYTTARDVVALMARRLLEGKGRREHGKGRHDGYTAARDGAALQRWTARRHDGYTTARDGAALWRWGAVTAPRRRGKARARQGMARQQHDGERRLCAGKVICHRFER